MKIFINKGSNLIELLVTDEITVKMLKDRIFENTSIEQHQQILSCMSMGSIVIVI